MLTPARLLAFLLLCALPCTGGQVQYTEITLEEVVRNSAWIVVAEPGTPAVSKLVARDPTTGWKTEYIASHHVVQRILKAESGQRLGRSGTIKVVADDLSELEMLGERAASKGFITPRLPDSEGTCPEAGPALLFLYRPNARGEYALVNDVCLPLSARPKVEQILRSQDSLADSVESVVPRLRTRPLKGLKKR